MLSSRIPLHTSHNTMKENSLQVLNEIKDKAGWVFNWFSANYFKAKPRKSHFLLTSNEQVNLNLNEHVSKLCKKASQKLHAIARISSYLNKDKLRLIMNAFSSS